MRGWKGDIIFSFWTDTSPLKCQQRSLQWESYSNNRDERLQLIVIRVKLSESGEAVRGNIIFSVMKSLS